MSDTRWTAADVPYQQGRTALVTGANAGIGFEVAMVLAVRGATVVLACRDTAKAEAAAARIRAAAPQAKTETLRIDLASLASVRRAAEQFRSGHRRLDLLINNAGLIHPGRATTEDGFELHFGTNHLGHFALTGQLLDRLLAAPGSRIVTVSASGHRRGDIHLVQTARMGALPTLRAAADPAASGGDYYGPAGLGEFTGYPARVHSSARSRDAGLQRRLWDESERLTGVSYRFAGSPAPHAD